MLIQNALRRTPRFIRPHGVDCGNIRHKQEALTITDQILTPRRFVSSEAKTPTTPDDLKSIESHKFCIYNVRKYDRENYLAALCIEDRLVRRVTFALRAFNVELSLIRDATTDVSRAKARFHFWSKLIDEIVRRDQQGDLNIHKENAYYRQSPVAKELLDIFYLVDVDKEIQQYLKDMIGARVSSKALGHKPFETMDELELYCFKSQSSLYHLCWRLDMQIKNVKDEDLELIHSIKSISDKLGIAHGLSNMIRGLPYNATKNCCYVPKDLQAKYELRDIDFVGKGFDGNKVKPIVQHLALRCQDLINQVYAEHANITSHFRAMFLSRIGIQYNLKRLKIKDYNICDPYVGRKNEKLPIILKLATKFYRVPII